MEFSGTDDHTDDDRLNLNTDVNDEDDDEPFDLDDLLPTIGEFGRYQKLLLWLICLPAWKKKNYVDLLVTNIIIFVRNTKFELLPNSRTIFCLIFVMNIMYLHIPCGFCAFNQLFMSDEPYGYWCNVSALQNISLEHRRFLSIPMEPDGSFSKCKRYSVDWQGILALNESILAPNTSWPTETCQEGWEYNTSEVFSSIVTDFDLVCDRDIYPTVGLACLNIGGPIGVYLFGLLNDRTGRRISYFSCLATLLIGSFLTAMSYNFWMWTVSRIIVGTTIPAVYQIPFIIALELVGPSYRSFVTVMTCTFYTFGIMMLAGVTYLVRDWVRMCLYTSVPFLLYFLYIFVMPESPRWLLAKGRLEEALKVLEVMARVNNRELPTSFRIKLEERVRMNKLKTKKKEKSIGAFDLFKTPNMRLKTLLITLNWFANETVYLGLSYYGPSLGNNQYLSFFLSSLVEIPSYLCCWVVMDRWGRRWPLCLLMILSGISCVFTVLIPEDAVVETLILFLISKSMISASFLIIYPFAGELYPTQVRGVGIGTSSYVGGMGLIVIPFITYLGKESLRLPLVVMGCISVIGGFTGLRLPETLHHRLPQTLEEGEEFGKDWNLDDCLRCIPLRPGNSHTGSYENIDGRNSSDVQMELSGTTNSNSTETEKTPLEIARQRRQSMRRLVRQGSTVDTQKTRDGNIQLTYWF